MSHLFTGSVSNSSRNGMFVRRLIPQPQLDAKENDEQYRVV